MAIVFENGVSLIDCILRLVVASVCGALIGFERTRRQKEAGIRTHIIVAIGATLMMIVSKYGFFDIVSFSHNGSNAFSGDRVAANIITGVSFLGAGMIFFRGSSIKGLTTAAGVWSTAGVGLAVGAGMYILAIVSTLLILIIQVIFHKWKLSADAQIFGVVEAVVAYDEARIDLIEETLKNHGIEVLASRFERLSGDAVKMIYTVQADNEISAQESLKIARTIPEIQMLEIHANT